MTNKDNEIEDELDRLTDALVRDILLLSDEQVIAEAKEDFGDIDEIVLCMKAVVQGSISEAGKRQMKAAKTNLATVESGIEGAIQNLSVDQKRQLLRTISDSQPLTMAARNEKELEEDDLDAMLQVLLKLGVIDEEGNIV